MLRSSQFFLHRAAVRQKHRLLSSQSSVNTPKSQTPPPKPSRPKYAPSDPPPPVPPQPAQGPINWKTLAIFAALGTGGLYYYGVKKENRMKEINSPKTIGKADIGGPFELIDGRDGSENAGSPFTEKDLAGRWTLVYFGFTMCPDICPDELTKISEALQILHKHGVKVASSSEATVTPVFISVDPERDSPARAAEYARGFHPAFVGLSGSEEQVKKTAKAYRVYYSKDGGKDDDYLVDHSIITYLMDPQGGFVEFYGKNSTAAEMAARIEAKLLAWKD